MLLSKDVLKLIVEKYLCNVNSPYFDFKQVGKLMVVSKFIQSCVPKNMKDAIKCVKDTKDSQSEFIENYVISLGHDPLKFYPCTICKKIVKIDNLSKHQRTCSIGINSKCDECELCRSIFPLFELTPHLKWYGGCPLKKIGCRKCSNFQIESVLIEIHEEECELTRYKSSVLCKGVNKDGNPCKVKTKSGKRLCHHHKSVENDWH